MDFSEKIINSNIYEFLVEHGSVNGLSTFCKKQNVFEKSGSWVMILNVKASQNAGFFQLQINWDVNLNFWMWLEVHKATNIDWLLRLCVLRHDWTCQKWWQIVIQLYINNELSHEVSFLHVVRIKGTNKFIQSFQVAVVRRTQNDSKQQIRMNLDMKLIRMNLGMRLNFCFLCN